MDASVIIVRSMDQSNSKEDWRANNNFTDTLKIDIRGFYVYVIADTLTYILWLETNELNKTVAADKH